MIITRDKTIVIKPENDYEKAVIENLLKNMCVHSNPKYEKMVKKGRFQKGVAKAIATYKFEKGYFHIYKANYKVYKELFNLNLPVSSIVDNRVSKPIEAEALYGPRDEEQRKAISVLFTFMKDFGYAALDAAPAAGKTYVACKLMTMLKERTLVLIDMDLLIEQFVDSITTFTTIKEEEIGIIRGGECEYGPDKKVIIATAQSLYKKPKLMDELAEDIGFIVCDECHVWSADIFQDVLPHFNPKYQLGLSGSHNRDDGMDFLVKESVGPIVHTIDRQALVNAGSMVTPILRPILLRDEEKFKEYSDKQVDFRTVVDEYYNCPKAIAKVSKMVLHYMAQGRSQLLICKEKKMVNAYYEQLMTCMVPADVKQKALDHIRIEYKKVADEAKSVSLMEPYNLATKTELKKLDLFGVEKKRLNEKYALKKEDAVKKLINKADKIKKMNWYDTDVVKETEACRSVEIVTGDLGKKERNRIIEETNSGKIKVLIVTTVMDKAVSISRLDTLYLLFSTRERANTIQRVGRVSRAFKGKKNAVVFDFIYDHYYSFYQFINRNGDCRLEAHREVTTVPPSIDLFTWWLGSRIKGEHMPFVKRQEFMEKYYKKYVIDLNK